MRKMIALTLLTIACALYSAFALAQGSTIENLPRQSQVFDADLFILESMEQPAGSRTSGLLASNLANYISAKIGLPLLPQPSNRFLGSPCSGTGAPTYRVLCAADLPSGAIVGSVSNSDGTLTVSPTFGAVVASLALAHPNTWTATQAFPNGSLTNAELANSSMTIAGHLVSLGGTQTLAASDLTNGTTGSGAVVLATSPALTTPSLGTPTAINLANALGLPIGGVGVVTGQLPIGNQSSIAANTVLGSIAGGVASALTTAQLTTLCNVFTSSLNGCVTSPGSPTGRVLSDNGTWITGGSGTVTEQKNTVGGGLVTSGNCDNVNTNAASPCNIALLFEPGTISNCILAGTVSGNALTVALQVPGGGNPSSTNPCVVSFRNVTKATGDYTAVLVTAATTFSTGTSGSTFGSSNGVPFRLWVTAFNNAGTVVLGVSSQSTSTQVFPINEGAPQSSTACSACTTAATAGVYYTTAAQTSKALRILGYMDWESGLTTAGTYASGPTAIQLMGPGVYKPGDTVQTVAAQSTATASSSSTTKVQANPSVAISPISAVDLVQIDVQGNIEQVSAGVSCMAEVSRSTSFTAPPTASITQFNAGTGAPAGVSLFAFDKPGTTSSTTYVPFLWTGASGTCTWNGAVLSGSPQATIVVREIMAALEPANDNTQPIRAAA